MNSRPVLLMALAVTLALVGWVASHDEAASEPLVAPLVRPAARAVTSGTGAAARSSISELEAALAGTWAPAPLASLRAPWRAADSAAVMAWSPPPPPPIPVAARAAAPSSPPPPQAPPMPYTLIGRLEAEGEVKALLAGPTRTLTAQVGDVLDGDWRVDAIRSNAITLTWLPANSSQTLAYKPL